MFTSADHTGYVVSDLDRSVKFWTDMGCKLLWQAYSPPEEAERVTGVAGNGVRIATLEVPGGYNVESVVPCHLYEVQAQLLRTLQFDLLALRRLLEYSHADQEVFRGKPTDRPTMHIAV